MNIFYQSYSDSDFFGKLIFLGLFILSVLSWTVLIRKLLVLKVVKLKGKDILAKIHETNLKSLLFANDPLSLDNPFSKVLHAIATKTSQILNKNHHFEGGNNVFLSKGDIEAIDDFSSITIYKEIKSLANDLFILSTAVTLAPFLGILGTVWGILICLGELQKGGSGSNTIVLEGLSTALATTVLGLVIAIPALIAYNYLKNSLSNISAEMEGFSSHVISELELQYKACKQ
jgi:biopolymer transport protein TolQ